MKNIFGNVPSSGQPPPFENSRDDIAWWCKFFARGVGTVGGCTMILGLWTCITFTSRCLVAGILQIFFGFVLVAFEAPCCCLWLDFIDKFATFSDTRPHWQKAFIYVVLGIIPVALCIELSTFFGGGMLFITGALYGMFALGRKADVATMSARASGVGDGMGTTLVDKNKDPVVTA